MTLFQVYLTLVLALLVVCAGWLVRDVLAKEDTEPSTPMVVAGLGLIVLTFGYLLAAIVLNQISS